MTATTDQPAGSQLAAPPRQRRRHRAAPPPRSYGKPIAALALAGVAVATGSTSAVAADHTPQDPTSSTGQMPTLSPALAAHAAALAAQRAEAQRAAEQAAQEALAAQQQAQPPAAEPSTTAPSSAPSTQGGSWAAWSSTTRPTPVVPAATGQATQGERVADSLTTTGPQPPLLVLGSEGRRVAAWQQSLNLWRSQHGLSSVASDGSFGSSTLSATVDFQRSTGILVDGIVGPITNGTMSQQGSSSSSSSNPSSSDSSAAVATSAVATAPASATPAVDTRSVASDSTSTAQDVAATAQRYLGVPYVYGGTSTAGFDCSGFTQYVFHQLGVDLPRTAGAQSATGTAVSAANAQLGDLVFFWSGGSVYHVGIYLGGGQMIAAPKPGDRVKVEAVYSSDVSYRRVL